MQEISPEIEIPTGMTVAFSRRNDIRVWYDINFHRRDTEDGYYFVFDSNTPLSKKEKVIPFLYTENPPSVIVDKNLKERLNSYIDETANYSLKLLEEVGKQGLVRTFLKSRISKEWRNRRANWRKTKGSLENTIQSLFHEEHSPSLFMQPYRYREEDKKEEKLFVRRDWTKLTLLVIPGLGIAPYSIIEDYRNRMQINYKKKFRPGEEDDPKILLSDFAAAYPLVTKGICNMLESCKHASNIIMYTGELTTSVLTYVYISPWLSYPLIALNCASGLTMAKNLIKSRGRDSSGLFSTILDRAFFDRLR
ncbi:hypothetical protein HYT51_01555 [Candidatus Woesearchaeota archaeon]|nr:hypothetical protein [Candidatus Woesearchaeota archaeon]